VTGPGPVSDREQVGARLTRLARHAPTRDGMDLAGRAIAVAHHRRLRAVRWVGAVLAVLVLVAAATLVRPEAGPAVQAAQVTRPPGPAVYERPPRGSLAGDAELLAAITALPWSPVPSGSGSSPFSDPSTRRVLFAADVPGGHRWAVVMASYGPQWVVNWFTGPSGADPSQLTEATAPTVWSPSEPLALLDVSADFGPLVLLTAPGATAEWSATLDRAPDRSLSREFVPLHEEDGVLVRLVRTPVTWDPTTDGELFQLREGVRSEVQSFLTTGTPPWMRTDPGPARPDTAEVAACLSANGFTVEAAPPSAGVYYADPRTGDLSSVEQAERDRASEDCFLADTRD
jgi:hypothetical protein